MNGGRRLLVVLGLAALLVPLVGTDVARADPTPTKVQISQSAQYVNQGQINLQISVLCSPGYGYYVQASVMQPQGFNQVFGSGFASGLCTGQQQKLAIPVYTSYWPGWQLGDAVGSLIACAGPCDGDTKAIHIVL
jgi:hypothetical protein